MYVIAILLVMNVITIFFATKPFSTPDNEVEVASVGEVSIERQQLWDELEQRFGQEVLSDLIDEEVIRQTALEYNISVTAEELETEMALIKAKYGSYDEQYLWNERNWEEQVEQKILLEKILVQSVQIPESAVEDAYHANKERYKVEKTYHLSHIIVEDKKTAQSLYDQLQDGASFNTLALEQSLDVSSAFQDGDIGYINEEQTRYPSYFKQAAKLKAGKYSKPFKVDQGYALIYVHEIIKAKTFSFKEVKQIIERELALEEMGHALTASYFWEEQNVEWNY